MTSPNTIRLLPRLRADIESSVSGVARSTRKIEREGTTKAGEERETDGWPLNSSNLPFFLTAPEEGLFCKPTYRASVMKTYTYIGFHFLYPTFLFLRLTFFPCRKGKSRAVYNSSSQVFLLIRFCNRSNTSQRFIAGVLPNSISLRQVLDLGNNDMKKRPVFYLIFRRCLCECVPTNTTFTLVESKAYYPLFV